MAKLLTFGAVLLLCAVYTSAARLNPDATITASNDDPKPIWHPMFSVKFNETTKFGPLLTWQTNGSWHYNALLKREVIYRDNGRGDRYCKSIHAFKDTPCVHIVNNGSRYINFPELKECCKCCDSAKGCGMLSPKWLDDASYEGTEEMFGRQVYKYSKRGLQPNYFYATADAQQLPVELDQVPTAYMTFNVSSFKPGPPSTSVFDVPADCEDKCPLASLCTIAQGWAGRG